MAQGVVVTSVDHLARVRDLDRADLAEGTPQEILDQTPHPFPIARTFRRPA